MPEGAPVQGFYTSKLYTVNLYKVEVKQLLKVKRGRLGSWSLRDKHPLFQHSPSNSLSFPGP